MNNYRRSLFAQIPLGLLALGLVQPCCLEAAAPRVTTLTASNVTATTASLRGTVNPSGTATTVWFEWGPGEAIKYRSATTNFAAGSNFLPFSAPASNLTSGMLYRCRAVASNSFGVVRGLPLPFGVPTVTLNGPGTQTNALYAPYAEAGAVASAPPVSIAVGDSHSLALKANGEVVGWGLDDNGQATATNTATNAVAVAAGYRHNLVLKEDGAVAGWGWNDFDQITIPLEALTNVMAIAAGGYHSLALKTDGTVTGWGSDELGQITASDQATNLIAIAAGYTHSLALRADGKVFQWGEFPIGLVAPPSAASNVVAIAAGYSHSLALRANGTVLVWGGEATNVVAVPASATNVVAIAAGYAHSLALRADGTIVGWGLNVYGEITIPAEATNAIALGAGLGHSQALRADGTVIGWGNPLPDAGQTSTPTNLTSFFPVTISGSVNTSVIGAYPLLYRATNVFGFAGSATRTVHVLVPNITSPTLSNGAFRFEVTNYIAGKTLTVLTSPDAARPANSWTVAGTATEYPAGYYAFTNAIAPGQPMVFYRLRVE